MIEGDLPAKAQSLVKEWAVKHKTELQKFGIRRNLSSCHHYNGYRRQKGYTMFYKIKDVKPLPEYNLLINFVNGECKQYNVASLFNKFESFKTLSNVKGLFEQVQVDSGGYGISWNDDIDLSCNELWENGRVVDYV